MGEEIIAGLMADLREEVEVRLRRKVSEWEVMGGLYLASGGWANIENLALACAEARGKIDKLSTAERQERGS